MKVLSLFCLLIVVSITNAQNLVPNPSFEEYNDCPLGLGGLGVVGLEELWIQNWYSMSVTPDYLHYCAGEGASNFPDSNAWGEQTPQDGSAYVSILTYTIFPDEREYIAVELSDALEPGETYTISFYVSDADGGELESADCSTNNLGLQFLLNPPYYWTTNIDNQSLLPTNYADINYSEVISDTSSWTLIQGNFVADQPYTHIALGNFFDDENTEVEQTGEDSCVALYYIDNVCVSSNSSDCLTDNFIFNSSDKEVVVYPNPAKEFISINSTIPIQSIFIYSISGELIRTLDHTSQNLDVSFLTNGLYQLVIKLDSGEQIHRLIHKLKL